MAFYNKLVEAGRTRLPSEELPLFVQVVEALSRTMAGFLSTDLTSVVVLLFFKAVLVERRSSLHQTLRSFPLRSRTFSSLFCTNRRVRKKKNAHKGTEKETHKDVVNFSHSSLYSPPPPIFLVQTLDISGRMGKSSRCVVSSFWVEYS